MDRVLEVPETTYGITDLFCRRCRPDAVTSFQTGFATRLTARLDARMTVKLDGFADHSGQCCFLRFGAGHGAEVTFVLAGAYRVSRAAAGGWLLLPMEDIPEAYWMPQLPRLRRLDAYGHILEERDAAWRDIGISPPQLAMTVQIPDEWTFDWLLWRLPSAGEGLSGLETSLPLETQPYFLWGSHAVYRHSADLYAHVIHGHGYENRFAWPKHWKICSENDVHALHTVLKGLEQASGKSIYALFRKQLLVSVLDRQSSDGGWRHGEWTDRMESHFRLHCSAMHLMMDALTERDDPATRSALARAAAFLARQTDELEVGVWFLHDELERSTEAMREGPLPWRPGRALGKSESNLLVLNSHLDAIVALDRYREMTGDARYEDLVAQAVSAARAVLCLRPAEWLYRPIFRAIELTFLPTSQAERLPLHLRALKRLAWKYLIPLLPRLKARFPRIVMPGGYIERELSLQGFAHDYLPINLMDLLRFRRRFPDDSIDSIIRSGFELGARCRMFERWPEIAGKEYAAGFWAEALYHACLAYSDEKYREWLAEAVIALEKRQMGLPPSLLGANPEAVAATDQVPAPVVDDRRLRVVNLSRKDAVELLIVNASDDGVPVRFLRNEPAGVSWRSAGTQGTSTRMPNEVQKADWIWARRERTAAGRPA